MNIDIAYNQYVAMPEDKKRDYIFLVDFGKFNGEKLKEEDCIYGKPLAELPFEKVKSFMTLYTTGDIQQIMQDIMDEKGLEFILGMKAWQVILSFRKILHDIENLIDIENRMLVSQYPSEYGGLAEQVDFTMFNQEYFQLNDLTGGDITKFDTIRKMSYKECFVQLLYIFKNNEFEKMVTKSMTK